MNKILKEITNEMFNTNLDYVNIKKGNYRVVRDSKNKYCIKHYYFGNCICYVDLNEDYFKLYNCGYDKYPLTTAQLNYLEKFYKEKGYKLIYRGR
jgi:hypothetical protein